MAFSNMTLVSATGDCATARLIVVTATIDIPAAAAAPKMLRGMIASIVNAIAVAYSLMTPWHVMFFTHAYGAGDTPS
jgi:hypothetical protein